MGVQRVPRKKVVPARIWAVAKDAFAARGEQLRRGNRVISTI